MNYTTYFELFIFLRNHDITMMQINFFEADVYHVMLRVNTYILVVQYIAIFHPMFNYDKFSTNSLENIIKYNLS